MLTVFDTLKYNKENMINFVVAAQISFGQLMLKELFKDSKEFQNQLLEGYKKVTSSDIFKHKIKKQIKSMLDDKIEVDKWK